jgi:hypothetical protein
VKQFGRTAGSTLGKVRAFQKYDLIPSRNRLYRHAQAGSSSSDNHEIPVFGNGPFDLARSNTHFRFLSIFTKITLFETFNNSSLLPNG